MLLERGCAFDHRRDFPVVRLGLVGPDFGVHGQLFEARLGLPFALPGKAPLHLAGLPPSPEDNLGLRLRVTSASDASALVYASAAASLQTVPRELDQCAALFMDGTFWSEQELPGQGIGNASARAMAHLPIGGDGGSLRALASLQVQRRIYTHINNTNPTLDPGSAERAAVEDAGWSIAFDGLKLSI